MRKAISAVTGLFLLAGAASADPVFGLWMSEPLDNGNSGTVIIARCGEFVCGHIGESFDSSGKAFKSQNAGKTVVWDMKPRGDGTYGDGKIWDPSSGKVYRSKMALDGNKLKLSGCIGPFCKSQVWMRIK